MEFKYCPLCAATLAHAMHGERSRNACAGCGWVHWDNPTPIVAAVIEYDGRLLLARNAAWPEKRFALVTGFLERDEDPAAAVAREVKEETDLDTVATHWIGNYGFSRLNQVILAYHVQARGTVTLSPELLEYRLIEPDKVMTWPRGTGLALADWLRARGLPVNFAELPS